MTKSTFTFRRGYLLYLLALAALMLAAVLYVRSVLSGYEANQPERQVEAAVASPPNILLVRRVPCPPPPTPRGSWSTTSTTTASLWPK